MVILFWLLPPVLVTLAAIVWVTRSPRMGEQRPIDREEAAARLGAAMQRETPAWASNRPAAPRDRSTGIAVRPSRRPRADARD